MLYAMYFRLIILFMLTLIPLQIIGATIVDKKCGSYLYSVRITEGSNVYETQFELFYKSDNQKSKLFYKTLPLFSLDTACIQNNKKQYFFIFQENYGGNTGPEDMFGVFDPNLKKILIKPSDWPKGNNEQVNKILGRDFNFIGNDSKFFFCCSNQLYNLRYGTS